MSCATLSRGLAEQGHYPAIDVEASISRAMHGLVSSEQFERVRRFKQLYSRYQRNRDLINVGAYVAGSDPQLDQAIAAHPRLDAYLEQDMRERVTLADGMRDLEQLLASIV
jgi:flagellum-specific ATP synthase